MGSTQPAGGYPYPSGPPVRHWHGRPRGRDPRL
jgi:hypothetical protein